MLGDGKMSVISGCRAEEFHLVQLTPGSGPHHAVSHRPGDSIVHNAQAGISKDDDLRRINTHNISHQTLCLSDTVHSAIIAHVNAFLALHIALRSQGIHYIHSHHQLAYRRLTAGHIQLQSLALGILKFLLQTALQFFTQLLICLHLSIPYLVIIG